MGNSICYWYNMWACHTDLFGLWKIRELFQYDPIYHNISFIMSNEQEKDCESSDDVDLVNIFFLHQREKNTLKNWTTSWPFSASEWLQGIVLVYSRCVMQIYFGSSWKLISYSSTGFDGVMLFAYFRQKIVVFFEGIWSSSITFCHNSFFSFFLQKLKSSLVSNLVRRSRDVIGKWGVESGLGKNTKM